MSDSQAYEEVGASSEGVTVTKRFEEDEFPVPAIAFEFVSEREEAVTVTLTDDVPESVAVEDLGFHPEYGSEYWTIDEDRITFEREFEPDAEYTTVYGIRATGADDIEQFLTEPVIEEVDPPESGEASDSEDIVPESDEIVKDVISGEAEVPGLDEDDEEEDIGTLDLKDPNNMAGQATGSTASSSAATATEDGQDPVDTDGSVVSAIADEIRQGEVPVEDLQLITQAIEELSDQEESESADGAVEARIERLQQDIADLRAYTDALEEFLDENGTAQQLIEDFESQVEEFRGTLDGVEGDLSETTETVEGVRDEMDGISAEVDDVADSVDSVEATVEDLERSLEDVQAAVSDLEEEMTEGDVAGRLDDIESDIQEFREWQEQIKSTFGG